MNSHRRMLVVADDQGTGESLAQCLREIGYDADVAASIPEAGDGPERRGYALYFLCLTPARSNDSCFRPLLQIRQHQPEASVIVATEHACLDAAVASLRHGAVAYVLSP